MVRAFHVACGLPYSDIPVALADYPGDLRVRLLLEESRELREAVRAHDLVETIDALCDVLYVAYGAADCLGEVVQTDIRDFSPSGRPRIDWEGMGWISGWVEYGVDGFARALKDGKRAEMVESLEAVVGMCADAQELLGIELFPFFAEVQASNMVKVGGPRNQHGKLMKPPGWQPPMIAEVWEQLYGGIQHGYSI